MHKGFAHTTKSLTPRAERFPIKVPVRYREKNRFEWQEGESENISGSGILFRAANVVFPNTPVELTFVMPSGNGDGGATVMCHGQAVRTMVSKAPSQSPTVGMRFQKYHMARNR